MRRSRGIPSPSDLAIDRARALDTAEVSRETAARLDDFLEMLLKWQQTTNLVAPSTLGQVWTRHVLDSLQLVDLAPDARIWVDLGSGGGFPGLVIACALAEQPAAKVHLVESNRKKAGFLREAARQLGLPALVRPERIEDAVPALASAALAGAALAAGRVDVVTARALAPVRQLLALAEPLLKTGTLGLFPKGQDVETELTDASKYWNIAAELVPSRTSP